MKRLAFAASVLALGFVTSAPARADYAVVRFDSGFCRIWWDSMANPAGTSWQKLVVAVDWSGALAALDAAVRDGTCR